ncbi:hypothetical protein M5K25_008873 [Dendrobium thyrsiflorum]|uniref:Gag-pol polyprotein n=1 Tax=Dendrobium thyrsiflorum TaxID=117978 RepID=A0ABD0VAQ3_DENTH
MVDAAYLDLLVGCFGYQPKAIHEKIDDKFAIIEEMMRKMLEFQAKTVSSEVGGVADDQGSGGNPDSIRRGRSKEHQGISQAKTPASQRSPSHEPKHDPTEQSNQTPRYQHRYSQADLPQQFSAFLQETHTSNQKNNPITIDSLSKLIKRSDFDSLSTNHQTRSIAN